MTESNALAPCPFCGAGTTSILENGRIWQGMKYGEPSSVSVLHHCDGPIGQPHRAIERVGKDRASAIAAWNRRAPAPASPPVAVPAGMEPYAQHAIWHEDNCTGLDWTQYHDASDPMPKTWDDEAPDVVVDLFTASQVQAMLAAVPRNATLYDPDEVAFPVQRCADGVDALPPELASTARPASIAAAEVAAPIAPAREPLTDEQIDEIHLANSDAYERGDVEYESHGFARAIEHHHGITAAPKGVQHGTD